MSGQPGRSGRRRRVVPAVFGTAPPAWAATDAQLGALGEAGRALVVRFMALFDFTVIEAETLLEAAVCTDRLAEIRRRRREVAEPKALLALDRLELGWSKQLVALLATLRP